MGVMRYFLQITSLFSGSEASRRGFFIAALGLLLPAAAAADSPPLAAALNPADTLGLQRVAAYLNGIHTMTARFTQRAANGVTTGTLWVSRPGRMRFEYNPPSPIVLIADTFYVYYYDKDLKQVQQVGLKSTPAWLLLRDPITFGPDVVVTRFERGNNHIRITVVERAHPDSGTLTMLFSDKPMALRGWTIVDQRGKTITVSLSNLKFGMALNPKLFQYHAPYPARREDSNY
jgi:outer membrane lipoprotein-sorting protein